MSNLRTAAQQALEAMDKATRYMSDSDYRNLNEAITALRAALAEEALQRLTDANQEIEAVLEQPEQTNPWRDAVDDELVSLHMVASDAPRESIRRLIDWHCAVQIDPLVSSAAQELIERGKREALEQTEQEPVAWMVYTQDGKSVCVTDNPADFIEWRSFPLYTQPPHREWQGLTEEEIVAIFLLAPTQPAFARAIEGALKQRNA